MEQLGMKRPLREKGQPAVGLRRNDVDPEDLTLINTAALAWITDTSKSTWEKMRMRGEGPPYIKVRNLVWYRWADVDAWLTSHEVSNREDV